MPVPVTIWPVTDPHSCDPQHAAYPRSSAAAKHPVTRTRSRPARPIRDMDPPAVVVAQEAVEAEEQEAHRRLVPRHRLPVVPPAIIGQIPVPATSRISRRRIARRKRRSARKRI